MNDTVNRPMVDPQDPPVPALRPIIWTVTISKPSMVKEPQTDWQTPLTHTVIAGGPHNRCSAVTTTSLEPGQLNVNAWKAV